MFWKCSCGLEFEETGDGQGARALQSHLMKCRRNRIEGHTGIGLVSDDGELLVKGSNMARAALFGYISKTGYTKKKKLKKLYQEGKITLEEYEQGLAKIEAELKEPQKPAETENEETEEPEAEEAEEAEEKKPAKQAAKAKRPSPVRAQAKYITVELDPFLLIYYEVTKAVYPSYQAPVGQWLSEVVQTLYALHPELGVGPLWEVIRRQPEFQKFSPFKEGEKSVAEANGPGYQPNV